VGDLLELLITAAQHPTADRYSLLAATPFPVDPEQLQLGAIIYAVLAVLGGSILAAGLGRAGSGRLYSLVLLAVGLVPYLALRYPVVFGGVLPWGLLFMFRRWGFWRIVIALAALAMFSGILIGRIRYGGFDFGASFFEALTTTGWLLLGGFLTYVLTRSVFGHHRLAYIGGAARREEYRASQRTETKRFRKWRDRKLNRAGKAVKQGDPYQGRHAPGQAGGNGGNGTQAPGPVAYSPMDHPDPKVRRHFAEGASGPIKGWEYDPYTGEMVRLDEFKRRRVERGEDPTP
jgi:hypothetical protein